MLRKKKKKNTKSYFTDKQQQVIVPKPIKRLRGQEYWQKIKPEMHLLNRNLIIPSINVVESFFFFFIMPGYVLQPIENFVWIKKDNVELQNRDKERLK